MQTEFFQWIVRLHCWAMLSVYMTVWWAGSVRDSSGVNNDVQVQFLYPHGPARRFYWRNREDICWVPAQHIITKMPVPTTATGRRYHLDEQLFVKKAKLFENFNWLADLPSVQILPKKLRDCVWFIALWVGLLFIAKEDMVCLYIMCSN